MESPETLPGSSKGMTELKDGRVAIVYLEGNWLRLTLVKLKDQDAKCKIVNLHVDDFSKIVALVRGLGPPLTDAT